MTFPAKKLTAELFIDGDSLAVRLPNEIRFEGNAVRVSKIGDKVILEPLERPPFDVKAWRARLDAYLDEPFPELEKDAPLAIDSTVLFD
jgi:antitoxin VapB